jgi:hypothetical protein
MGGCRREVGRKREKEMRKKNMMGPTLWRGLWRPSKNGHLGIEVPLELSFFIKPPNFGVDAHLEAPTGVVIRQLIIIHDSLNGTRHLCICIYIYVHTHSMLLSTKETEWASN